MLSLMTKQEMDSWIATLVEGGSRVPLARLPLASVTELLMHSVSLLRQSQTDNGSSGSPPNESSTHTSPTSQSETADSPLSRRGASSLVGHLVDDAERPAKPEMDDV